MGMLIMPYALFFELLAPIIETTGFFFLIYQVYTQQINFATFWLMLLYVYLIGVSISTLTIVFDISIKKQYRSISEYLKLILFSSFEAFLYHPFVVFFSLKGYWQFLTRKNFKWGTMTRQGFQTKSESEAA